jgi:hypothetical protein
MPNIWPIADGNWSVPSTWSGSVIPTSADDVFTNNRRVNIDIDATVRSIRNSATGSAVASAAQGNCFYLNDGVTLTANAGGVIGAVTNGSYFPTIIVSGSSSARIIANITSSVQFGNAILLLNGASLTITGSVVPTLADANYQQITIRSSSTGTLRISGSILNGGGTYFGATIRLLAATRLDVNGTVFGSLTISGYHTIDTNGAAGATLITITGSIVGSSIQPGAAIGNYSTGTVIISGSVTSGAVGSGILNRSTGTIIVTGSITTVSGYGISNESTGTVSVSGSVTAGTGNSGIISTTAGRITVIGPISASRSFPGIQSTSTGNVFLTGPFLNINNRNAVFAQNLQLISGSTPTWQFDTETYGGTKILYTSGSVTGYPSISNVRNGVIYGDTNQFTGTVVIPAASNVIRGALVGNTTGSASFTTQNAWSAATGSLTVSGSIGARLRNTATVNTDAALITTRRKI